MAPVVAAAPCTANSSVAAPSGQREAGQSDRVGRRRKSVSVDSISSVHGLLLIPDHRKESDTTCSLLLLANDTPVRHEYWIALRFHLSYSCHAEPPPFTCIFCQQTQTPKDLP